MQNSVNEFAALLVLYNQENNFTVQIPLFWTAPLLGHFWGTPSCPKNPSATVFALSHTPHKQLK